MWFGFQREERETSKDDCSGITQEMRSDFSFVASKANSQFFPIQAQPCSESDQPCPKSDFDRIETFEISRLLLDSSFDMSEILHIYMHFLLIQT